MKKLPLFLLAGISVAAVAALIAGYLHRRRFTYTADNIRSGVDYASGIGTEAEKTFTGFNYNTVLSDDAKNSVGEITVLQKMLNAYYGTQVAPVTGKWNAATGNAVRDVTGKPSTSLYEFRYMYFAPFRGDALAAQIIAESTEQA